MQGRANGADQCFNCPLGKIWRILPAFRTFAKAKNQQKGTVAVPFSFLGMANEEAVAHIETLVKQILAEEPEYFCVSIRIKPTNNIKVFIDGDNGLAIEKCVRFNRKLYKLIEETGRYPEGEFSLELSSPGLEEPLKLHRQYQKNIDRYVTVTFLDDSIKEGKLLTVTENDILLENTEGKGKKAITQQILIPFINIKSTTVQIKF